MLNDLKSQRATLASEQAKLEAELAVAKADFSRLKAEAIRLVGEPKEGVDILVHVTAEGERLSSEAAAKTALLEKALSAYRAGDYPQVVLLLKEGG